MSSKIITVWGSNGSGKTTIAANLGIAIAERNLMVGIISSKLYYGELQGIFAKRLENDKGIYNAIANGCNTKNMFESAITGSNLFFLSVPNGFDAMLLTAVSGDTAKELIEDAVMRFDYIIIDGNEELNNPISSIGLTMSSKIVVSHRASTKDCIWQSSMENTMQLLNLTDKAIHVLNGYDKTCDNCVSDSRRYAKPFIPIVTEYMLIYHKDDPFLISYSKRLGNSVDISQKDVAGLTWHHLIRATLEKLGGEARLIDLYDYLAEHPKSKKNEHYKERIRATIYEHKEQYIQTGNGSYRLTYKVA